MHVSLPADVPFADHRGLLGAPTLAEVVVAEAEAATGGGGGKSKEEIAAETNKIERKVE